MSTDKPEKAHRKIHINEVDACREYRFPSNYVSTTKYNLLTFLPKSLYEQFRRIANLYFTVVAALSCFEALSPVHWSSTIPPLVLVIGISITKEAYEDYKRYIADTEMNSSTVLVWRDGQYTDAQWQDIKVGENIKVMCGQFFPADILMLKSSDSEGICYVETMNLDGETNLKIKKALDHTSSWSDKDVSAVKGSIECEVPNNLIYNYTGNLYPGRESNKYPRSSFAHEPKSDINDDIAPIPLGPVQLLLRGASLRNTEFIIGCVIYSGHDTKVMMNATDPPSKRSAIEKGIDSIILCMFFLLFLMCIIGAAACAQWTQSRGPDMWYLIPEEPDTLEFAPDDAPLLALANIVTAFILYGYLIPISLYVSIEMVKVAQMVFINMDHKMYYAETDTPALARTSNLNEELGQVDCVLSDKTGTLTCNVMEFFKCSIAGVTYGTGCTEVERANARRAGKDLPPDPIPPHKTKGFNFHDDKLMDGNWRKEGHPDIIAHFFRLLAICHTIIPEGLPDSEDGVSYQAESPDELAFVMAAKQFGFYLTKRTATSVFVQEKNADGSTTETEYEILNILDFNSTRKRMSVIFRSPSGAITLYCKGADTVIYERLRTTGNLFKEVTYKHLEEYSLTGLRTLCLAATEIDPQEYAEWQVKWEEAKASLEDREGKVAAVSELIEKNMVLLGSTAIEDKLQNGVPECIELLGNAGIRLWVLTGDKQETAINIGFACSLLRNEMVQYIVNVDTPEVQAAEALGDKQAVESVTERCISQQLIDSLEDIHKNEAQGILVDNALIIDGRALSFALKDGICQHFLALGLRCGAVICCRVSPLQKAQVTNLVKESGNTTLAIGDGANDVGMIQMAHIGVGISGLEGRQAVMASDFAIAQFRFLERLLMDHGRWCYKRIGRMVAYFFYKNILFGLTLFWYNMFAFFSGQTIYNEYFMTTYNVFFVSLPILVVGIFDQDISPEFARRYPRIYQQGPQNVYFNFKVKMAWMLNGVYQSCIIASFVMGCLYLFSDRKSGKTVDLWSAGTAMYTCVVCAVNLNLALAINFWTIIHHLVIWGSILLWFLFLVVFGYFPHSWSTYVYKLFIEVVSTSPTYWLLVIVTIAVCLLPDLCFRVLQRQFFPEDHHIIQEIQAAHETAHTQIGSYRSGQEVEMGKAGKTG
eukprot:gene4996-6085_t